MFQLLPSRGRRATHNRGVRGTRRANEIARRPLPPLTPSSIIGLTPHLRRCSATAVSTRHLLLLFTPPRPAPPPPRQHLRPYTFAPSSPSTPRPRTRTRAPLHCSAPSQLPRPRSVTLCPHSPSSPLLISIASHHADVELTQSGRLTVLASLLNGVMVYSSKYVCCYSTYYFGIVMMGVIFLVYALFHSRGESAATSLA